MPKSTIKIPRDASPWGDRLSLAEAAGFLRMGKSTLQKKMADGTGPRGSLFNQRWEFEESNWFAGGSRRPSNSD